MAIASGGIVFGDDADVVKIEDVKPSDLGQVGEIVITKDDTLILRGTWKVYHLIYSKQVHQAISLLHTFYKQSKK